MRNRPGEKGPAMPVGAAEECTPQVRTCARRIFASILAGNATSPSVVRNGNMHGFPAHISSPRALLALTVTAAARCGSARMPGIAGMPVVRPARRPN